MVLPVAEAIGCSRNALHTWLREDAELKEAQVSAKEGLIDFAEGKLLKKIKEDDLTAIIFFLKTQGRRRDYADKQEIEHSGGVQHNVTFKIIGND